MSSNAKKNWIEALREMCDALEPLDAKERAKALAAFWAVHSAPEREAIDRVEAMLRSQR